MQQCWSGNEFAEFWTLSGDKKRSAKESGGNPAVQG